MGGQGSGHIYVISKPCHHHPTYNLLFELKFHSSQLHYFLATGCGYAWKSYICGAKPLAGHFCQYSLAQAITGWARIAIKLFLFTVRTLQAEHCCRKNSEADIRTRGRWLTYDNAIHSAMRVPPLIKHNSWKRGKFLLEPIYLTVNKNKDSRRILRKTFFKRLSSSV